MTYAAVPYVVVQMMEDGGCRVVSGGRLGMALEALLAAGGGGQSIF